MEKKQNYECTECGAAYVKWVGRCSRCKNWNTLQVAEDSAIFPQDVPPGKIHRLDQVDDQEFSRRLESQVREFDRVLGGGLICGSVGIIGGEPGIGKSTLILQLVAKYNSLGIKTLYVSGEESVAQIKNRADRLTLKQDQILMMAETRLEKILSGIEEFKPELVFIDSIHTVKNEGSASIAGGVNQVREISALLVNYAKTHNVSVVLIGHVTKEGFLAGPKTLEHIVDYAVYLDGDKNQSTRILRAVKNRFGSLNEIGLFKMTEKGLAELKNSNELFLKQGIGEHHGTAIYPSQEGSRLLLAEVQALVAERESEYFTRTAIGVEKNRILMLVAILEKYLGIYLQGRDLYVNLGGGLRTNDPAIDMAILAAILSSHKKQALGSDALFWGEVTLTGRFRSSKSWENRMEEIERSGFKRVFLPAEIGKKKTFGSVQIIPLAEIGELNHHLKN